MRGKTFCLNSAIDWAVERGVKPHGCVMMEIDAWPEEIPLKPYPGVTYYLASMTSPRTYERLRGGKIVQWHFGAAKTVPIMGGSNAACNAISIGVALGYRKFELFGVDSSFEGQSHAYEHVEEQDYQDRVITVDVDGQKFPTTGVLWRQARQIMDMCYDCRGMFDLRVHGHGLLPYAHALEFPQCYEGYDV